MTTATAKIRPVWGLVAFFFAAAAMIAVTLHVSDVFAEPEKSAAATIGEFAAEIRLSAKRALAGEPAEALPPAAPGWNAERVLLFTVPVLAGLAVCLGAVGLFRREPSTLPLLAIGGGAGAFVMLFAFWLALLIGGVFLMVAIINNIGDILGGFGG